MRKVLERRSAQGQSMAYMPATSLRLMTSLKWLAPLSVLAALTIAGCGNNTNTGGSTGSGSGDAVATVNGEPVSRAEILTAAEAQAGEGVLRQVIMQQLVLQELKKQGLSVSDEEVEKGLQEELERSGGSEELKKILATPGARLESLKDQVRNEIALNRLITKDVKVDEAALKKWFEAPAMKTRYDKPERMRIGLLLASTKVRADTMASQLKSGSKTFAQLVEEQKKASDPAAGSSTVEVPNEIPVASLAQFPKALAEAIKNTKEGQNSAVVKMEQGAQSAFAIVRVNKRVPAEKADFAKLKDTLEQDYKLEQSAREAMKKQGGNFDQMLKNMEQGMGPGQKPPYRQVLNYMVQQSKQDLLNRLQGEAKIDVTDPAYEKVEEQFKPTPAPAGGPGAPAGGPAGAGAPPASAPPAGAPPAGAPR